MGRDKAFLDYQGEALLARALDLARSVSRSVWVVGSRDKFADYADVVEDLFPGRGPLAGIHAALESSQTEFNLMISVDMPLLTHEFLQYLVERARSSEATVTVPRTGGRWQPLCGVYRRNFSALALEGLLGNKNKIDTLFLKTETLTIEEDELTRAGFSSALFCNINTPQEWEKLEAHEGRY